MALSGSAREREINHLVEHGRAATEAVAYYQIGFSDYKID